MVMCRDTVEGASLSTSMIWQRQSSPPRKLISARRRASSFRALVMVK